MSGTSSASRYRFPGNAVPGGDRCSAHPSVIAGSDDGGGAAVQLEPGLKSWFTCAAQSRQINALMPTTSRPASPSFRPQKEQASMTRLRRISRGI